MELVREQLYRRLHKSLPYRLEPQLVGVQLGGGDDYGGSTNWQPSSSSLSSSSSSLPAGAGPVTIIDLVIHVGSPQVRAIVLGPGGRLLNQEVVGEP